ncbi:hypothetical protein N7U66_06445 [Lacinutrix neustonica]|uniref:Uncharacterized protein n=1 Tax=Lacinutrix neustonica TaxID=2980107 RepID=A0A9E8SFB0_9FLAO|nr:hypothetical protein [Lacinutrix neustonica]WAC03214.1 hypothetical protein N7U66_06445 [Lacinutrix neustonica]
MQNLDLYIKKHPKLVRMVQYVLMGLFVFLILFDIILAATDNITISEVIKGETEKAFFVLTYFTGRFSHEFIYYKKKQQISQRCPGHYYSLWSGCTDFLFKNRSIINGCCF